MNQPQERSYEIVPMADALGGGWKLRLFVDGQDAGAGVFPVLEETAELGMSWWNSIPEQHRAYWLSKAGSAVPAEARHAYLLDDAYRDAQEEGEAWVGT